ncbi:phosphorylase b kinase regulatory subunit beta isoform A [Patagioenas fasciata monilis]|uniref:Phosphorylase b kinase regulatory subunit n=1 Tax=Patagioenas fasciata monilis TaxID=372326 RepID=A0A1V4JQ11_PATFA|nr:phosphorylase b kinase regulatory subunit beta isoform A [Patagioenas fasciata monilis]
MLELRARSKRSGSIYEPLQSINLPKPEGESLWDKLDHYYRIVKSTLLLHQSPTTGLFPTKTYGDNRKAKVHDSLYCAACAWALALAYRRIDDDKGRTHELEHSAIKCMRGILYCYMRQADKVQQFKQDPKPSGCLHSVFSADTGDEVFSHKEYGHLQINAVSLFLLYLVEMISSGLQIVYNTDEVSFIQNLVFCVERAYRVPDFGVWERGSKYNNGSPELHSRAALGLSSLWISTPITATDRLSVPCYPASQGLITPMQLFCPVSVILRLLWMMRFLRDGYRTALEDKTRRYYKPAEIKLFDGIECEFPLFFIFMIIDGVFRGNPAQVKEYQDLLDPLLQHTSEGCPVVPKYYYVPADFVDQEKKSPGSQKRFPSHSGRDGKLFLWGQAVYIIAKLLADKLVSPKDIDPIGRYVAPQDQRNVSMRFSNQGPLENDLVVHVALIAESQRLQVFLNTYGIQTQTPQQVEPIQIWAQKELVKAYFHLGVNDKLALSGRPDRPIGCLGTSKIYRILGKTVVCYSIIFDLSDFYMSQDVMMLIDDIKNALQFIKQYWKMHGRPLFVVLIREDNIRGSRFNPILDMLAAFRKGLVGGVKVHVDRVQTLISGAVVEQLDFLRIAETEEAPVFKSLEELDLPKHSKVKRQSSTPNASELEQQPDVNVNEWRNKSTYEILQKLNDCNCLASQAILSSILLKREGPNFITKEGTVAEHIERIYRRAGSKKLWSVVRFAASLLGKLVDSLAPSITNVLVQGKQVTLGAFGQEEAVISNPLSPAVIKNILYEKCHFQDEREAVVQQELVIHIGWIISNSPELFSGMLQIRVGWIIHAMKYELQIRAGDMPAKDLYQMSPSEVKQLLLDILQPQQQGRSWLNRRQIDGCLNRTPAGFYDRVWQILERTPNGLIVAGKFLPQQPTLSDMTMYEMNFSLLVEDMLQNIDQPEYRQIIVELLMVISVILERNPELEFQDKVDLDKVVQEALHDFQKDHSSPKADVTVFYNTPPLGRKGTCSYLSKAVISLLLEGELRPSGEDPCTIS